MATISVRLLDEDGRLHTGDESLLEDAKSACCAWIDVLGVEADSLAKVGSSFGLHPLAIEDCLHFPQRPKLDVYDDVLFVVWLVAHSAPTGIISAREVDFFLGRTWLITVHDSEFDTITSMLADPKPLLSRGAEWTMHGVVDRLVDSMFPVIDALEERLERLEEIMLDRADRADLEELHMLRRRLHALYRIISPERDVLRALARYEQLVSMDAYRYFVDVGDHLARVQDAIETDREIAASAMDVYLSSVSNRANAIMKQLTVVATIFMPLTLISGIYGMNVVKGMWPPSDAAWSFGGIIVGMAFIALGMSLYFRRKNWW